MTRATWPPKKPRRRLRKRIRDELRYFVARPRFGRIEEQLQANPPLIIGGTGGSGTRLVVNLCQAAGWFMGNDLTRSFDAPEGTWWVRRWIQQAMGEKLAAMSPSQRIRMDREWNLALTRHRRGLTEPNAPWGIKNPGLFLILPYLDRRFPLMKFIHVLRDGRDMAFSKNQNQLRKHGTQWLGDGYGDAEEWIRSIAFWARTNLAQADYGEQKMSGRYMRLRFEDLCREPVDATAKLFAFLGTDPAGVAAATACIRPPGSIGRWRGQDPAIVEAVSKEGAQALRRFGYADD
jgi:Sulfotransferase family